MFTLEGQIPAQSKNRIIFTCPETPKTLQVEFPRAQRGCSWPKFSQPAVAKRGFPDTPFPSKARAAEGHIPEEPQSPLGKPLWEFHGLHTSQGVKGNTVKPGNGPLRSGHSQRCWGVDLTLRESQKRSWPCPEGHASSSGNSPTFWLKTAHGTPVHFR